MPRRWLILACLGSLLAAGEVHFNAAQNRIRPSEIITVGYTISGDISGYTASVTSSNNNVLTAVVTKGVNDGSVLITCKPVTTVSEQTITLKVTPTGGILISDTLRLVVDPLPKLSSTIPAIVLSEETQITVPCTFVDTTDVQLHCSLGTSTQLQAAFAPDPIHDDNTFPITITGNLDVNSVLTPNITLPCIVTDDYGSVTIQVPVTINPVNDPPQLAYDALPDRRMDPALGSPIAVCAGLRLSDPIDGSVSLANSAKTEFLGWNAAVQALDGSDTQATDLLSLCGDASFRIDGANITVVQTGVVVGTWSRPDGRTDRLAVRLNAAGNQAQLQAIAALLRYAHRQSPAQELVRRIVLQAQEPNGGSGTAASNTCSIDCSVLAVNRPPIVTLNPLQVEPGAHKKLDLTLNDSDGLDRLTVTVLPPLPRAGRVEPLTCTGSQATATDGGIVYTPTADDLSDDSITLQVSDGRSDPVVVSTVISIRSVPDRVSIISDPPLELVHGTASLPVQCVPGDAVLSLADYGAPMPSRPAGLSYADGALRIDWSQVPPKLGWMAWTLVATSAKGEAKQRVLVRIVPGDPD